MTISLTPFELFIYYHPWLTIFPLFILCFFLYIKSQNMTDNKFKYLMYFIFFVLLMTAIFWLSKFIIMKLMAV